MTAKKPRLHSLSNASTAIAPVKATVNSATQTNAERCSYVRTALCRTKKTPAAIVINRPITACHHSLHPAAAVMEFFCTRAICAATTQTNSVSFCLQSGDTGIIMIEISCSRIAGIPQPAPTSGQQASNYTGIGIPLENTRHSPVKLRPGWTIHAPSTYERLTIELSQG